MLINGIVSSTNYRKSQNEQHTFGSVVLMDWTVAGILHGGPPPCFNTEHSN